MDYYKNEIKEILDETVERNYGYETRDEIIERWRDGDTQDDFGNMTGSRFCSAYLAEEALKKAGFPFDSELNDILKDAGYGFDILDHGPEVVDVILCELILPFVVDEL